MALMDITVIPLDKGPAGLSAGVAQLQEILRKSGLDHKLHDMGTTVSGSSRELFALAEQLHEHLFSTGTQRVYTVMKIDDRRDKEVALGDKTASVERKRGRQGSVQD